MPQPTSLVFDASQAYEVIKIESVRWDLDFLLDRARTYGIGIVQVLNAARCICSTTKSLHRHQDDRIVIASNRIKRCVDV